jgi:hypothetical protein
MQWGETKGARQVRLENTRSLTNRVKDSEKVYRRDSLHELSKEDYDISEED